MIRKAIEQAPSAEGAWAMLLSGTKRPAGGRI
jgi:hypothetical protein